jgi:uncharacterized membrane protein YkvA (DUF1232 family)
MGDQNEFYPTGLTRSQFNRLTAFVEQASGKPVTDLQAGVRQHLEQTRAAHSRNRLVNLRLAIAISEVVDQAVFRWGDLPANARNWLAGAFLYFANCNDDEPDFSSPIGFEDDTEVLNACLRFAKLNELCLEVEDYDDA